MANDFILGKIIVIAGSSEGIGAVARLIQALPSSFPVPLVAQLHDARNENVMALVRKNRDMPSHLRVIVAVEGEQLRRGNLYLAPPGYDVFLSAPGVLGVTPTPKKTCQTLPADRLFETAAKFHQQCVIGVVLSGKGRDGTNGLLSIHHFGGVGVAQSPIEATFSEMPISAVMGDHV